MGGRLEREGIYGYLELIHVVQWKFSQHCKAIIFQLKKFLKEKIMEEKQTFQQVPSGKSEEPGEGSWPGATRPSAQRMSQVEV